MAGGQGELSIPRPAERAEPGGITVDERLLLGARPMLKLSFPATRDGKRRTDFNSEYYLRTVECGRSAGLARDMVIKSLVECFEILLQYSKLFFQRTLC